MAEEIEITLPTCTCSGCGKLLEITVRAAVSSKLPRIVLSPGICDCNDPEAVPCFIAERRSTWRYIPAKAQGSEGGAAVVKTQ